MFTLIVRLVMVLSATGFFAEAIVCQEVRSFDISRTLNHQIGHYSFNGIGRLETSISQTIANSNALFFENETIQLELELVDSQRSAYASAVNAWHNSWEETVNEIQRVNRVEKRSREFNLEMLSENDRNAMASLNDVLLPHQINIVNELQFRCLFRTHGMNALLKNDQLCEVLALSDNERSLIKNKTRELRTKVSRQVKVAIEDVIKMLIEPIQDSDRAQFLKRWEHLFSADSFLSLEELIVFLDSQSYEWMQDDSEPLQKLLNRPSYETGPAGDLHPVDGPKYRNVELNIFREFWKHPDFKEYLDLSESNELQLSKFVQDSYRSSQLLLNLSIAGNGDKNIPFKVRQEKAYAESDEIEQASIANIRRVLGMEGWDRVGQFADRINIASAGLVYDLIDGEFAETLELSEIERKKILVVWDS